MNRRFAALALSCVLSTANAPAHTAQPPAHPQKTAQPKTAPPKPSQTKATQKTQQPQEFGKSYATLRPVQRRLIDDYIRRYNQTTGKKIVAQKAYDDARMSVRTTFDAVTHALLTAKMTDEKGKSLGHAIDLVDAIDDVMGEEQKVGGDRQFRIYVYLKPNTFDILTRAREFKRERDNSVYHKGFPICFRLENGPPSIQISMSRDRHMADIDVDYRSSTFPKALVNGHLTASNSDVRAGNNLDRHDGRWQGLTGWWRDVFGMGGSGKVPKDSESRSASQFPLNPQLKADRGVDEAAHDFLKTWTVDRNPTQAIAYLSRRSYACLEEMARQNRKPIPPGMVRLRLKMAMDQFNQKIGSAKTVADVFEPPPDWSPKLKDAKNAYPAEFRLVAVPTDVGLDNECVQETASGKSSKEKYFATAFQSKVAGERNEVLSLLWAKEGDYWKIVAIRLLDASDANITPKAETPQPVSAESAPQRVAGDTNAIRDTTEFYRLWLNARDFRKTMQYVSEQSYSCAKDAAQGAKTPAQLGDQIRTGLKRVDDAMAPGKKLSDRMTAIDPVNELIRSVEHENANAFALMVVPDQMADGFLCEHRSKRSKGAELKPAAATYGKYYATASSLNLKDDEQSPTLILLWASEKDRWKVVAWAIEVP